MNYKFTISAIFALFVPLTVQAQQQAETYTLTVTSQEAGLIGQALGELPFKTVAPILKKLEDQYTKQVMEKAEAAKANKAEEPPKQ